MKKMLFFLSLSMLVVFWSGCKKCYHCQNVCVNCILTYQGHAINHTLCKDTLTEAAYNAVVANDSINGFICTPAASSYNYDFCVNKPGEATYLNYFNEGGRAKCTTK